MTTENRASERVSESDMRRTLEKLVSCEDQDQRTIGALWAGLCLGRQNPRRAGFRNGACEPAEVRITRLRAGRNAR